METVKIEFSGEDLDMILEYQEVSEATTIQNAIMNAISLALDHADDCVIEVEKMEDVLPLLKEDIELLGDSVEERKTKSDIAKLLELLQDDCKQLR